MFTIYLRCARQQCQGLTHINLFNPQNNHIKKNEAEIFKYLGQCHIASLWDSQEKKTQAKLVQSSHSD